MKPAQALNERSQIDHLMESYQLAAGLRRGLSAGDAIRLIGEIAFGLDYYNYVYEYHSTRQLGRDEEKEDKDRANSIDFIVDPQAAATMVLIALLYDEVITACALNVRGARSSKALEIRPSYWAETNDLTSLFSQSTMGFIPTDFKDHQAEDHNIPHGTPKNSNFDRNEYEIRAVGNLISIVEAVDEHQLKRLTLAREPEQYRVHNWAEFMAVAWREMYRRQRDELKRQKIEALPVPTMTIIRQSIGAYAQHQGWKPPGDSTALGYLKTIADQAASFRGG